jgi:hypothetical protein
MSTGNLDQKVWLSPLVPDRDFQVQFRDDHINITIGPKYKTSRKQRKELWAAIRSASEQYGSRRILLEGVRPRTELSTGEVIEAGQHASAKPSLWIAFCMDELYPDDQRELFEVVAASRGVRAKFFTDRDKALTWLRRNCRE